MVVSAIVQAGAAVVIGAFMVALWRSTSKLAQATQKDVELTEQIARLQSVVLARHAAAGAPSLIASVGDRNVGDYAVNLLLVDNIGDSAAYEIEIDTSWGMGRASGPLAVGSREKVTVGLPKDEWESRSDQDPIIQRFRFRDRQGIRWTQDLGEAPVRLE